MGRGKAVSAETRAQIIAAIGEATRDGDESYNSTAARFGVSRQTVSVLAKRAGAGRRGDAKFALTGGRWVPERGIMRWEAS